MMNDLFKIMFLAANKIMSISHVPGPIEVTKNIKVIKS